MPPVQVFLDALGATGGKLLLLIVIGAQFFYGMSSVTGRDLPPRAHGPIRRVT